MTKPSDRQKQLHHDVTNVGLRAQATAVGLVQLCIELHKANAISEQALTAIKKAISDELLIGPYRRHSSRDQRADVEARIERIFSGEQKLGPVDDLSMLTEEA